MKEIVCKTGTGRIMFKRSIAISVVIIELLFCIISSIPMTACARRSFSADNNDNTESFGDTINTSVETFDVTYQDIPDTDESLSSDVPKEPETIVDTTLPELEQHTDAIQTADLPGSEPSVSTQASTTVDTTEATPSVDLDVIISNSLNCLRYSVSELTYGDEWIVLALEMGGKSNNSLRSGYISSVTGFVKEKLALNDGFPSTALDKHKATENARVILSLLSVGADPYNVAGYDLVSAMYETDWVCGLTLNNPIYALIALDSCRDNNDTVIGELVDYILSMQLDDGGWALSGTRTDPDVTAMALLALSRHRDRGDVASSAARAIVSLSSIQLDTGEYRSWGRINSESISQVIIALCAWGIDPTTDSRFIKRGISAFDALLSYTTESGFADVLGANGRAAETSRIATEQASIALCAYLRLISGHGAVFDFR